MDDLDLFIKTSIERTVTERNGLKATELVAIVTSDIFTSKITYRPEYQNSDISEKLFTTLDSMIKNGDIIEVKYILPNMNYREKSFLLPKGTTLS